MDKKELQELLSQSYKQENWKKIVSFVFPNVSILSTPKEFPINNDKIKTFRQLGIVRLNDGKSIALFELFLSDTVNIHRNRVELNNEISKYIDQEQIHGVLSVFEQGTEDYRFTFSARSTEFDVEESDFIQKKTDTKRYTYVLGKNESCKTPAERFFELSEKKSEVDIIAIQNAFSVEKLSKEFFENYKKQFGKFWRYIHTHDDYSKIIFGMDREKGIRDFTKKLLGRIVFLYFIQKKGWMGCTAGTNEWKDGQKHFMQTLFNNYSDQSKFHSKCLAELFYNTLNKRRIDDLFVIDGLSGFLSKSKVPYLNGGLFDSDEDITRKIDFPTSYFEELFNFFGQYNFTIDENDPNDHEVGIDPEMLGHIFENLLEDNKDKGAFYTPKVIVQYMCQESIIEYINTKINGVDSSEIKSAIEDLIRNRLSGKCSDLDLAKPISKALFEVKICDPAIGSGAFPMGILNVIYSAIEELYFIQPDSVASIWNISDIDWQPNLVKKNIIQHSIYGVDLESGAVDIARLRFWLALVVDEVEPLPLPNLDFKIMQGNSLLESFEGIDLSQINDSTAYEEVYESYQIDIFTGEAKKSVNISLNFEDIKSLMDEYFNVNCPVAKKEIHKRIDDQVLNHIRYTLMQHKKSVLTKKSALERKLKLEEASVSTWQQKEKIRKASKLAMELAKINSDLKVFLGREIKLAQLSNSNERPFFLWHLFFKDVFEKGGFDIVIGNPPYIGEKGNKGIFNSIKNSNYSKFYLRKMDFFYFFFHLGIDILKDNSVLSFITTNYYVTATGGTKLREDLFNRANIIKLINFKEAKIFPSALGQHNLITFLKKSIQTNQTYIISVNNNGVLSNNNYLNIFSGLDKATSYVYKNKSELFDGEKKYMRITSASSDNELNVFVENIISKIDSTCTVKLGTLVDINQGLRTGADKVSPKHIADFKLNDSLFTKGEGIFILTDKEIEALNLNSFELTKIKPLFKNSDIKKYVASDKTKFRLIDIFWPNDRSIDINTIPNIFRHLQKYQIILKNRKENANGLDKAIDKGFYYFGSVRRKLDFSIPKIVSPQRSKSNVFALTNGDWYASADVYCISSPSTQTCLKYIIGILNSKLYYQWFYHRGKRKGEMLELYQKPLSETPIMLIKNQSIIVDLVNDIIEKKLIGKKTLEQEFKLNILVAKIYKLNYNEFLYLYGNEILDISESEYDSCKI
jgi:adenine-specific DNA-methyltransferase